MSHFDLSKLSEEQKEASRRAATRARSRPKARPEGWNPFGNAPEPIQRQYRGLLAGAHKGPTDAIKLFCIECMGYSQSEAKTCATLTCPLFAFNRRIFG